MISIFRERSHKHSSWVIGKRICAWNGHKKWSFNWSLQSLTLFACFFETYCEKTFVLWQSHRSCATWQLNLFLFCRSRKEKKISYKRQHQYHSHKHIHSLFIWWSLDSVALSTFVRKNWADLNRSITSRKVITTFASDEAWRNLSFSLSW